MVPGEAAERPLGPVLQADGTTRFATMGAAVHLVVAFHAMPEDAAATVGTRRCEHVDCALEAIEDVRSPCVDHANDLVVLVAAHLATP